MVVAEKGGSECVGYQQGNWLNSKMRAGGVSKVVVRLGQQSCGQVVSAKLWAGGVSKVEVRF